jgi:hypothetical protein
MTWKVFLGIGRLLCGAVLAWMLLSRPNKRSLATILSDGRIEFSPNRLAYWAWPLTIVLLAWTATKDLMQSQGRPFELVMGGGVGLLALMLLFSFPGSVVITVDGLEEVYWFRTRKRIQWKDVVEINTGEKSRTVTITGADGTRIVHSTQLPDRPRLLMELKNRCGENLPPDFPREPSTEE